MVSHKFFILCLHGSFSKKKNKFGIVTKSEMSSGSVFAISFLIMYLSALRKMKSLSDILLPLQNAINMSNGYTFTINALLQIS